MLLPGGQDKSRGIGTPSYRFRMRKGGPAAVHIHPHVGGRGERAGAEGAGAEVGMGPRWARLAGTVNDGYCERKGDTGTVHAGGRGERGWGGG